jgi:arginine deiminase
VLLHRPGPELRRLTPSNHDELLFDDVLWVERARQEHDLFAGALRGRGVEVLYVTDLLAEALAGEGARTWLLGQVVDERALGTELAERTAAALAALDPAALVERLVGGLTVAELGEAAGLTAAVLGPRGFVLPPLPNLVFTRDTSCWIGAGVSLNPMASAVRRPETALLETVYRFSPRFTAQPVTVWYGGSGEDRGGATVEGGDVLVLGLDVVLVGTGQRTTPQAAEALAARLFAAGAASCVLVTSLPRARAFMHLDTVLTLAAPDTVVAYRAVVDDLPTWSVTPGAGGRLRVREEDGALPAIARALGQPSLRVLPPALDPVEAEREQWDDGSNVLAVAPGVVVAYERNARTNAALGDAGIEVLSVPASELGRGRGGPRCMSCPLDRDPA